MTSLTFPVPYHQSREYRARRSAIIRFLRNPKLERAVAAVILFGVGFAVACQI